MSDDIDLVGGGLKTVTGETVVDGENTLIAKHVKIVSGAVTVTGGATETTLAKLVDPTTWLKAGENHLGEVGGSSAQIQASPANTEVEEAPIKEETIEKPVEELKEPVIKEESLFTKT